MFYALVFHVLGKELVKNRGRFGVLKYREKGRDLTQSYDKSPYTNRNVKRDNNTFCLLRGQQHIKGTTTRFVF